MLYMCGRLVAWYYHVLGGAGNGLRGGPVGGTGTCMAFVSGTSVGTLLGMMPPPGRHDDTVVTVGATGCKCVWYMTGGPSRGCSIPGWIM